MQAANHQPIVGGLRHVRQQIAKIHAALTMLRKPSRTAHQPRRFFFNKGEPDLFGHALRQRLTIQFLQLGLRIKQIHLTRRALHEDEDAILCPRRKMRLPHCQRVHHRCGGRGWCDETLLYQQSTQRQTAQAIGARGQKITPRLLNLLFKRMHQMETAKTEPTLAHPNSLRKTGKPLAVVGGEKKWLNMPSTTRTSEQGKIPLLICGAFLPSLGCFFVDSGSRALTSLSIRAMNWPGLLPLPSHEAVFFAIAALERSRRRCR